MEIKIKFTKSDLIKPTILNLGENVNSFVKIKPEDDNDIDLSDLNWVNPLSILPLASLLSSLKKNKYQFKIIQPLNSSIESYLKAISFYEGIHSLESLENLRHKNYIPIVSLPNHPSDLKNREKLLSCLLDILLERIGCKENLINATGYAFMEMFDNIWEHSQTDCGWFFAQYYKNKGYADICFLDNGITIKGSYSKKGRKTITDHEAIKMALMGKSTKDQDRGYGLWTTKKLITESPLNGKFLILSGQNGYFKDKKQELLFNLNYFWQGTIIFLRINKTKEKIDYTKFIE